jgi:hypothetical protein
MVAELVRVHFDRIVHQKQGVDKAESRGSKVECHFLLIKIQCQRLDEVGEFNIG